MDEKIKNAKSTLKILGILSIILGILGIIIGAMALLGGGLLFGDAATSGSLNSVDAETATMVTGLVLVGSALILVSGIFTLLLGIFSVRASNDFSKVGPAYVLALIDLVLSIVGLAMTFMNGINVSSILECIVGIVFAACIFWAAKTIRDNA